jgi:hypothetical protein
MVPGHPVGRNSLALTMDFGVILDGIMSMDQVETDLLKLVMASNNLH